MSLYRDLVKDIGDENVHLLEDGENSAEFTGWIDTGSLMLNALCSGSLYGGVPNNKILGLAGEEATGKTYFALGMVEAFMKKAEDAGSIYYDTESAVTRDMMQNRGIDSKRLIVSEPSTVQEFRYMALQALKRYMDFKPKDRPPLMMILDSMGQLSTSKEMEDTESGSETKDMGRAALLKATFRVLNLKLAKAKVPMIVTNHVYDKVGSFIPQKEMGGGSGLKYSASTILFLTKKKDRDGTDIAGNIITVTAQKSRFTKQYSKVQCKLSYETGLNRYYGLLDLGVEYDILKKAAKGYEMPDGSKHGEKKIYADPERFFTPDLMEKLEKAANEKFMYGSVLGEAKSEDKMKDEGFESDNEEKGENT